MLKKIGLFLITLIGVTIVAFGLIRMVPGDPAMMMIGERGTSPEAYAEMKSTLGLDQSYPTQYFLYGGAAGCPDARAEVQYQIAGAGVLPDESARQFQRE